MDRYKVVKKIGSGSQGEVFLAHDTSTGKSVAVKSMLAPSGFSVNRVFLSASSSSSSSSSSSPTAAAAAAAAPTTKNEKAAKIAATAQRNAAHNILKDNDGVNHHHHNHDDDDDDGDGYDEYDNEASLQQYPPMMLPLPHTGGSLSSLSSTRSEDSSSFSEGDDDYDSDENTRDRDVEKLLEEVQWLMTFEHENIVNHLDYFVEVTKTFTGESMRVFVVMEYCDAGDLQSFIKRWYQSQQTLPIDFVRRFTHQLCNCINFLHANNIIHRDIKAENVLLSRKDPDVDVSDLNNLVFKIADFGCTRVLEDKLLKTFQGTIIYMAPEVYDGKRYDESADIWSLGIVIYQLLTLTPSEQLPNFKQIIKKSPQFVKHQFIGMDNKIKRIAEIVHWCLKIDPAERPTAQELLAFLNSPNRLQLRRSMRLSPSDPRLMRVQSDIQDVLSEIRSEQGKNFWSTNNFQDYTQVEWPDFVQAYQKFIGYKKLEKAVMRGLKKLLCVKSRNVVTFGSFDEAIERVGFPFDLSMVARIEEFMHDNEDVNGKNGNSNLDLDIDSDMLDMSHEEMEEARDRYITMIINHDKMFIDPITQQAMNVEKNCVPLRVELGGDWDEVINERAPSSIQQTLTIESHADGSKTFRQRNEDIQRRRSLSSIPVEHGEDAVDFITSMKPGARAIVVAAAAAGKTVLTKLLLLKAAQMTKNFKSDMIPLYVPISTLCNLPNADGLSFAMQIIRASADSFLNKGFKYADSIERFLLTSIREGNMFLLFDGLDEASDSTRKKIGNEILQLSGEMYDQGIIVITSRATGFEDMYNIGNIPDGAMAVNAPGDTSIMFSQFLLLKLLPLSTETQVKMAKNRGVDDQLFINALRNERFPTSISSTPLLLSLLIHEFRRKQKLTLNRAELFEQAINTMIDIYMRKKNMHVLSSVKRNKEQIEIKYFLSRLAQMLHMHRKRDFTRHDPALKSMASSDSRFRTRWESTILDIENGFFPLIESLNQTHFRFTHLSFQEYLVAKVWASPSEPSLLRSVKTNKTMTMLFRKQQSIEFSDQFKDKILDPWYRETLMVCVSIMSARDFKHFVKWILKLYGKNASMVTPVLMKALDERPPDAVNVKESETQDYLRKMILKKSKSNTTVFEALLSDSALLRQLAAKDSNFLSNSNESFGFLLKRLMSDYIVCKEGWRALVEWEQKRGLLISTKRYSMPSPRESSSPSDFSGALLADGTSTEPIIPYLLRLVSSSNSNNQNYSNSSSNVNNYNNNSISSGSNSIGSGTSDTASPTGGLIAFNDRLKAKVILALASACSAKQRGDEQCQRIVHVLLDLCSHYDKGVRWACAKALKKIAPLGSREVMSTLVQMIEIPNHKEDAAYTIQICKALTKLGCASTWKWRAENEDLQLHMKITNTLLMLLHSEDDGVKMHAIEALGSVIGGDPEDHMLGSLSAEFAEFPYWIYIEHFQRFLEKSKSFEQELPAESASDIIMLLLSNYVANRPIPSSSKTLQASGLTNTSSARSLSLSRKKSSFRRFAQQQQQQQLQDDARLSDSSDSSADAFVRIIAVSCIVTLLKQYPQECDTDTLRTIVLQLQNSLNNDPSPLMRLEAIHALSKLYDLIPKLSSSVSMSASTPDPIGDDLSDVTSASSSSSSSMTPPTDLGRLSLELDKSQSQMPQRNSRQRSLSVSATDINESALNIPVVSNVGGTQRRKGSLLQVTTNLTTDKTQHAILNCLLHVIINDDDAHVRRQAATALLHHVDPFSATVSDRQSISRMIANLHKALDFATKNSSPNENDLVYTIAGLSLSVDQMLDFFSKRYKKKSNRTIIFDVFVKRVQFERQANKDWTLKSSQLNLLQSLKYPESHFMLVVACN